MSNPIRMRGDIERLKTTIICTLAPAQIKEVDDIKKFVEAGMRVVRLNFSHIEEYTEQEKTRLKELERIQELNDDQKKELELLKEKEKRDRNLAWQLIGFIREAEKELKTPIGIMMDLCGPRLRTGKIRGKNTEILPDQPYSFISEVNVEGDNRQCSISSEDYSPGRNFIRDVKNSYEQQRTRLRQLNREREKGKQLNRAEIEELNMLQGFFIYINDGRLKFEVINVDERSIICKVVRGGNLETRKGVNVPYCKLHLPAVTPKDDRDLEWILGKEKERRRSDPEFVGIDYVAESFVKHQDDVVGLRTILNAHGREDILIIAKIETPEALERLPSILKAADGVMVARGDLGVEISLAKVPKQQRNIINNARIIYGDAERLYDVGPKFVIVATQMLESMIKGVQPLRAEVTDINTAVLEGADGIMTSAETIDAEAPTEVVRRMVEIALEAEGERDNTGYGKPQVEERTLNDEKAAQYIGLAESACILAQNKNSPAIVVSTWSGRGAKIVSSLKPPPKIIAITDNKTTIKHLLMYSGVYPVLVEPPPSTKQTGGTEDFLELMQRVLQELGIWKKGGADLIAFFGIELDKAPIGPDTISNTLRLIKVAP